MARILVVGDSPRLLPNDAPVLMDEEVKPDHLADEHLSHQIIERVAWAVLDAEEVTDRRVVDADGPRERAGAPAARRARN
jgi:hypothetical protein